MVKTRQQNRKKSSNKSKQLLKDFEKKKRKKLGKKLKPANATEISFRSHSIHVSKQSLKDQHRELRKTVALVSFDIKEALTHLSHHKPKVRQDVLIELKSILSRIEDDEQTFRHVLHQNLVEIVSIFELVYDTETIVRNTVRTFMNWFMPRCKNHIELFGPFWSSILAHLSAALSHINTKIRYNALKILRSFFSVSNVATYFHSKWCLSLLSHLQLLFYDIIRSGHFILNDDDIKMITSLSKEHNMCESSSNNKSSQNSSTQKLKKELTNHQETIVIVHILCECATHIIKVIQTQMHNSYDSVENNLHALLLPNETKEVNKMNVDQEDDMELNMMNNDNMNLLKSLLCMFASCCLIFEQFAKKKKYAAMSMVLTLCCIITDCLCDNTMKQLLEDHLEYQQKQIAKYKLLKSKKGMFKRTKFKLNDLRLFISKSLMSLFHVFPLEFVEMQSENDHEEKQTIDKLYVMRLNVKTMKMCCMFIDYWDIKLQLLSTQNKEKSKKRLNYFKISHKWLKRCLNDMSSGNTDANARILTDVLQILKLLIGFYDETKQLQLLISIDKLMKNAAFIDNAKTIFTQIVH